jgi:translation initiation factor 3 subunit C
MSRFFATGDTDTESSSESQDEQPVTVARAAPVRKPQYFSSDEEEEKRVVRSQKDKRFDELKEIIHGMRNRQKIRDIFKLQTEFESLQKCYMKSRNILEKEGGAPKFYIKAIAELEKYIQMLWDDRDAKQKLSKVNAKALASLKQKVRKYNKDFEDEIKHFNENPDQYEEENEEEEEEQENDDDDDVLSDDDDKDIIDDKPSKLPPVTKAESDSDDDSDEWGGSSDDESSGSSSSSEHAPGEYRYTAEYFLKRKTTEDDTAAKAKKRERKEKEARAIKEGQLRREEKEEQEEEEGWETVQRKGTGLLTEKEKMKSLFGKDKMELSGSDVLKKRDELVSSRGRKSTDRMEQIKILQYLHDLASGANLGVGVSLRILLDIADAAFDVPSSSSFMKDEMWKFCLDYLVKVLNTLEANSTVEIYPFTDDLINYTDPTKPYKIFGSLLGYLERMNEEYIKILQNTDAHSTDYLTKLQADSTIADIIKRTQLYFESKTHLTQDIDLCKIYITRIEHLYYKVDRENYGKSADEISAQSAEDTPTQLITKLCKFIYSYPGQDVGPIRTRAVLCHIYHLAIHNRWFEARDLMLMTHLQENIQFADVPTQILYNRTIVQLGMCAFRHGMMKDSHEALIDILSSPRSKDTKAKELAKELLAQGLTPRPDRTPEQEKLEKRRQVPFHMHINLELMECVYLTSAMLLEIPYMSATEVEGRRRMISKGFYHQLKNHEKQPLVGPPETMREHVVAAANAMKKGNWKQCRDYILNIKSWNLFINVDEVKLMLTSQIQEETLRTYIFTYGAVYDSLSLHRLSEMFELPLTTVHSIISRMIIKEELLASLDEPTQCIVMHHAKPTKLQSLALNLAEKIGTLADHNEELLKVKQGSGWSMSYDVI